MTQWSWHYRLRNLILDHRQEAIWKLATDKVIEYQMGMLHLVGPVLSRENVRWRCGFRLRFWQRSGRSGIETTF